MSLICLMRLGPFSQRHTIPSHKSKQTVYYINGILIADRTISSYYIYAKCETRNCLVRSISLWFDKNGGPGRERVECRECSEEPILSASFGSIIRPSSVRARIIRRASGFPHYGFSLPGSPVVYTVSLHATNAIRPAAPQLVVARQTNLGRLSWRPRYCFLRQIPADRRRCWFPPF